MNRENTIQLMMNNVHPDTMISVIFEYIFDRTGERVENQNINIHPFSMIMIQQNYQLAMEWFMKKFNVNILYNKEGQVIKIY